MATNAIVKILTIAFSRLNLKEFSNFMNRVFDLLGKATAEELGYLQADYTAFMNDMMLLRDIVSQSFISDQTEKMNELEGMRDHLVVYLLTTIKTSRTLPIASVQKAAISLYNATKTYIGTQDLPNQQETAQILGLINDLSKEENSVHVQTLKLADVIEKLDEINNDYARLTAERTNEQAAAQLEAGKIVRQRMTEQYDRITTLVFAKSITAGNAKTETFIRDLNALISEVKGLYNLRKGIAKANEEKKEAKKS